jgi:glycerol-3-phosphate acyltransferase PlsY
MLGTLETLFWIAEHWWIFALVAVVALGAVLWTGIVQLGAVIVAAAKIAAAVARFFATPADQIAAKVLFGFCVAVLALSAGFQHGRHVTNADWARREAARVAAMERLRAET